MTQPTPPSPQKLQANRKNARKSTGPRTPEGKARSALNALKHGLTAAEVVLPNEDAGAFQAEMADWVDHFRPGDPAQRGMIERAVHAGWKLRRCARVETATLGARVRHAADRFELDEHARAEELGRRLTREPSSRFHRPPTRDPAADAALRRPDADDPALLVRQLRAFAQGVEWLRARWRSLAGSLDRDGFWHHPEAFQAVRLAGRRPEDVLDDPEVARVFLACNTAHPEPWDLYDDVALARLGSDAPPVYRPRVDALRPLRPASKADARVILTGIAARELARLDALSAGPLVGVAEADRAGAADRAMFDDTPTGTLFRRYETNCERAFLKAVADLTRVRKAAPVRNEPTAEPAAEEPVAPADPVEPPAPRPEPSSRPSERPRTAASGPKPAAKRRRSASG